MKTEASTKATYLRSPGKGTTTEMQCPHCRSQRGVGYGVGKYHFANGHVDTEHGEERLWRCFEDERHLFLGPRISATTHEKLNSHFVQNP